MRCTELTLMPAACAIISAVQCVASPGGSPRVKATVRSCTLAGRGGMREGRVLSRNRPSTRPHVNRLQTRTVGRTHLDCNPSRMLTPVGRDHTPFRTLMLDFIH
jgi:hypothetical protein